MKTALAFFIAIAFAGCIKTVPPTIDTVANTLLNKVVVENMDLDLDTPQKRDDQHLWDAFANKPYESQFSQLSTKNWFAVCERFQTRILSLAESGRFDAGSLRSALANLNLKKSDKTARVPVGAFAARKGTEKVWIIVLKWEYAGLYEEDGKTHWSRLGHIQVVAFMMKDGKEVASVECD